VCTIYLIHLILYEPEGNEKCVQEGTSYNVECQRKEISFLWKSETCHFFLWVRALVRLRFKKSWRNGIIIVASHQNPPSYTTEVVQYMQEEFTLEVVISSFQSQPLLPLLTLLLLDIASSSLFLCRLKKVCRLRREESIAWEEMTIISGVSFDAMEQ